MKKTLLLLGAFALLGQSMAQSLPRRAFMGVRLGAISAELQAQLSLPDQNGVHIQQVFPQSSAEAAGLKEADVIVRMDQHTVKDVPDFLARLKSYQTGDRLPLRIYRQGQAQKLELELMPFPEESYPEARLSYGAVQGPLGTLRSIRTDPTISQPKGIVYIIQGIDCGSVDLPFNPQSGIAQLIGHLNEAGYATYRVEKSGIGDSQGKPCRECDFAEDLEGFQAGLRSLKTAHPDAKIYLLGLSMGGVWGPLIAAEESVAGIMVYGTIGRPFQEYMLENSRRQGILEGAKPASLEKRLKRDAALYHYLYHEGLSPSQIIAQFPEMENRLRQFSSERDPAAEIRHLHAGRLYTFQQQLQAADVMGAWQAVSAPVLVLWGKGDYVSDPDDHQYIAEVVNQQHPGHATYLQVEADHWFGQASTWEEAFANRANRSNPPLNRDVFKAFTDWLARWEGS